MRFEPFIEFSRCFVNAEMGETHGQTTHRAADPAQSLSGAPDAVGFPGSVSLKIDGRFDDGKRLEGFTSPAGNGIGIPTPRAQKEQREVGQNAGEFRAQPGVIGVAPSSMRSATGFTLRAPERQEGLRNSRRTAQAGKPFTRRSFPIECSHDSRGHRLRRAPSG